tara:strand:+ start:660 stop:851 length:192 start_codon:yes stop_codon:yes gene_type:complete
MAKIVSIEFTDEQWELIQTNFPVIKNGMWVNFSTEDEFIAELKRHVDEETERGRIEQIRKDNA